MFTKLDIHLTAPICSCNVCNLGWKLIYRTEAENTLCLDIQCNICNAMLVVPYSIMVASFTFDVPYPEMDKEEKVAKVLKLVTNIKPQEKTEHE